MRLTEEEIRNLKTSLSLLDSNARLYLFGSRVDDHKKGGDIDLLVISSKLNTKDLSTLRWNFYDVFGEQKMDILLDDGHLNHPFVKKIFPQAIQL